jgi:excisionase family DNA binding protein
MGETMVDDRLSSAPQSASGGRDRLLTPGEVATLFRVDPKTVTRWASAGRIGSIRTPGGHRRFRESEVRALLRGVDSEVSVPAQTTPTSAPFAGRPVVS